jgi:hypothetical protein
MHEIYYDELEKYIDYEYYADWYDEVAVCVSFFLRHPELQKEDTASRLARLEQQARIAGDIGLLDFFDLGELGIN